MLLVLQRHSAKLLSHVPSLASLNRSAKQPALWPTAISTSTATPTVTATADSERACGAIVLESQSGVTVSGSTANGVDHAGGASCGFSGGGNGAPDVVYEYVAPAAGIYDIRVQAASFAAYLYVRANTCAPSEPELGCTAGDGQTDPQVTLTLAQGQSVAIVVDGESPRGGTFTLNIKQRQPDLVVTDISAPTEVTAGEQIQLAAEVTNIGNDAAGPFTVLFLLARDAALTQPLGSRFAACTLDGLAPGQTQICQALTPLDVPLVTEGTYYVGASADARHEVKDANRDNNALASGVVLHTVGVQLVQQLFRAADGSAYQLVRALPTLTRTDQEEYRITTVVGARSNSVEACQVGEVVYASVAGASPALEVGGTRTKRVAPPNESVQWSPDGSGLLILGDGPAQLEVCARDGDCDGNQLLPGAGLLVGDDTIRQACFSQQTDSFCQGLGPDEVAFAFGLPPADFNECGDQPTRFRLPCDQAPDDGFSLRAGEAVVFVYRSAALDPVLGLRPDDPFSVGIAGFAIDRDGVNAVQCTSGGVIGSEVLVVQPTGIPTPSDTPTPGPSPTGPRATPTVA